MFHIDVAATAGEGGGFSEVWAEHPPNKQNNMQDSYASKNGNSTIFYIFSVFLVYIVCIITKEIVNIQIGLKSRYKTNVVHPSTASFL